MKKINFITIILFVFVFVFAGCNLNTTTSQTNEAQPVNVAESNNANTNEISKDNNLVDKTKINEKTPIEVETELDEIKTVNEPQTTTTLFENSYREFNLEEYNLALKSDYYVVLDFYSNWCPSCKKEDSILQSSFNTLENIVIFKVNHEDSDTSDDEKALAEKFDISKRDSGIILKNGEEFSRYLGHKSESEYREIFNSLK